MSLRKSFIKYTSNIQYPTSGVKKKKAQETLYRGISLLFVSLVEGTSPLYPFVSSSVKQEVTVIPILEAWGE